MKKLQIVSITLAALLLAGCGEPAQEPMRQESMAEPMAADHSRWEQEPYYILQFNMDSVISNAPSAAASSSRVVLSQGGTYLLSGTLEDAQLVADEVKRRYGVEQIIINSIGPVIGAHTGPGCVAMFFMGKHR